MEKFQKAKVLSYALIGACIFISVVWGMLIWNDLHIRTLNTEKYLTYKTGLDGYELELENVTVEKDKISITKDHIMISGWVVNTNESMNYSEINVVLTDTNTNISYLVPTTMTERTDITEQFDNGNRYNWSGFSVKIPFKKINTEKNNYEIKTLLKINGNDTVIVDSGKTTEDFKTNEE